MIAWLQRQFRFPDGVAPNLLALTVTIAGWPLGVAMLTFRFWPFWIAGVLLTSLSLIWSAYYLHEFAHSAIFRSPQANRRWGILMSWINGSCVSGFDRIRAKHMRHHLDRADVLTFAWHDFLHRSPAWFRGAVLALEWLYIPVVELIFRVVDVVHSCRKGFAKRVLAILLVRAAAFASLAWISPRALLLYGFSYLLMITALRFADCFQHTYQVYSTEDGGALSQELVRDRAYEQANTYSNVVGLDCFWLNLIWLNFGYHNAHHERPIEPWHRLPKVHEALFGADYAQIVTMPELLKAFHIHRLRRVVDSDYGRVLPPQPHRADGFVGAVGVSFLTGV